MVSPEDGLCHSQDDLFLSVSTSELTKECEKVKTGGGGTGLADGGVAWEELQVVRSERDQAVQQAKTLRQTVTGLENEKQVGGVSMSTSSTHENVQGDWILKRHLCF